MLFPGEKEAIERMLADAKKYGYGNFIGHLKRAWIDMLKQEGFGEENAKPATEVEPCPLSWEEIKDRFYEGRSE